MQTPIYYAAREGATKICELLINYGADLNIEDKQNQTSLFYAIKFGREETVEFLIKSGADVNKVDKKKISCYHFALKNDRPNIAELLVKYGANTELPDNKKTTKKIKQESEKEKEVPRYNKYVLVKLNDEGKSRLSIEELQAFEAKYKELNILLNNKDALEDLEKDVVDERLYYTEGWEKPCKKVLSILWKMKDASLFHKPVDPIELQIPDYPTIIKNPMDFGTIKRKLNNGFYVNFREFDDDVNLVFNNCIIYNGVSNISLFFSFRIKAWLEQFV